MAFTVDIAALQNIGKDYLDALPTAAPEEIDAGWMRFSRAFESAVLVSPYERAQATALHNFLAREKLTREASLATV